MAEDIDNVDEAERVEAAPVVETGSLTLPLSLTLAALTIYFGFQTFHLLSERSNLALVKASQEAAIQEAQKVQGQFKTLVTKISELAEKGHAGAKMVMEELLQRGVSSVPETTPPVSKAPGKVETKPTK
jgi:hypothetical protein